MMELAEAFKNLVHQRRSVRAFLPQPVPGETLRSVFELAQRAPSNCNTQPWQVAVASGATIERLRKLIPPAFEAGQWSMDFPYEGQYRDRYKERQYAAAKALYDAMGIRREDKTDRHRQFMRNFEFFGAPHVAFLFLPAEFGLREAADLGMYAQNLMLSLSAHGLASCPQTALSFHAELVRRELKLGDDNKLLFGISFGVEDTRASANRCWTERAEITQAVIFYD